ncbi:Crp/Fnr family transcriptional regulator [Methylobacterium oxalidis]|uniref:Crp/Fnr family transcriptional regulator n=1 Tax=Methylobacterium oxalidis TaxID=944322 RepID=UPI002795F85F|nr:Crp/Fnr family transcriptional regulator [Methylobacterium oxalidis]
MRKLESIGPLSAEERQAVESLPVKTRVLEPGHDIVNDGDQPSHSCLVLSGWVCRYKMLSLGRRQVLSFHVAGDIPDLQSLHLPLMDYSLAPLTRSAVAFIAHESLRELTATFPGLAAVLTRDLLIDAAAYRAWLTGLGRRSAYERLAHLFCELYLRQQAVGLAEAHRCPLPITQMDLGDALGLSNVHVNRVLKEMRGSGLVTLRAGTLVIEKWPELAQAAEFDPSYLHLRSGHAV